MIILRSLFSLLIVSSSLWGQEIKRELQLMQLGVTVGDYKEIIEKNKANLRIFTFLDKKEKVYIMYVLNRELKAMDRRMKIIKISTKNFKGRGFNS